VKKSIIFDMNSFLSIFTIELKKMQKKSLLKISHRSSYPFYRTGTDTYMIFWIHNAGENLGKNHAFMK